MASSCRSVRRSFWGFVRTTCWSFQGCRRSSRSSPRWCLGSWSVPRCLNEWSWSMPLCGISLRVAQGTWCRIPSWAPASCGFHAHWAGSASGLALLSEGNQGRSETLLLALSSPSSRTTEPSGWLWVSHWIVWAGFWSAGHWGESFCGQLAIPVTSMNRAYLKTVLHDLVLLCLHQAVKTLKWLLDLFTIFEWRLWPERRLVRWLVLLWKLEITVYVFVCVYLLVSKPGPVPERC